MSEPVLVYDASTAPTQRFTREEQAVEAKIAAGFAAEGRLESTFGVRREEFGGHLGITTVVGPGPDVTDEQIAAIRPHLAAIAEILGS